MFADLDEARRRFAALEDLVIHQPGGWADEAALRKSRTLLAAARGALDDPECRATLTAIEPLLADLYSEAGHQKWDHVQTSGRDFLRLRILRDLSALDQRISELEEVRRVSQDNLGPRFRGGDTVPE